MNNNNLVHFIGINNNNPKKRSIDHHENRENIEELLNRGIQFNYYKKKKVVQNIDLQAISKQKAKQDCVQERVFGVDISNRGDHQNYFRNKSFGRAYLASTFTSDKAYGPGITPTDRAYGSGTTSSDRAYGGGITSSDRAYGGGTTTSAKAYGGVTTTSVRAYGGRTITSDR